MINEEKHPNIARVLDDNLHKQIVDFFEEYLIMEEGLSREDFLEKVDICYDENNIPVPITMDMVERIVADVDDLEDYIESVQS
jgi:hypothetical protein